MTPIFFFTVLHPPTPQHSPPTYRTPPPWPSGRQVFLVFWVTTWSCSVCYTLDLIILCTCTVIIIPSPPPPPIPSANYGWWWRLTDRQLSGYFPVFTMCKKVKGLENYRRQQRKSEEKKNRKTKKSPLKTKKTPKSFGTRSGWIYPPHYHPPKILDVVPY